MSLASFELPFSSTFDLFISDAGLPFVFKRACSLYPCCDSLAQIFLPVRSAMRWAHFGRCVHLMTMVALRRHRSIGQKPEKPEANFQLTLVKGPHRAHICLTIQKPNLPHCNHDCRRERMCGPASSYVGGEAIH
jgi:hypothetical protein